ncbi:DUF4342 domain-containing protein [Candidatus Margulisiibacteriota bacterium]
MEFKKEEFEVMGKDLVEKTKEIVKEGNARRIVIKQEDKVIVEFPLTLGVVGAVLAPMLAALGAIAALIGKCTIEVEKKV